MSLWGVLGVTGRLRAAHMQSDTKLLRDYEGGQTYASSLGVDSGRMAPCDLYLPGYRLVGAEQCRAGS